MRVCLVALLALSTFLMALTPTTEAAKLRGVPDTLLKGSYHGTVFAAEHGWLFLQVKFHEFGRQMLATQLAVAAKKYNVTCNVESYAMPASPDADGIERVEAEGVVRVPLGLPDFEKKRGCLHHRARDGDLSDIRIVAVFAAETFDKAVRHGHRNVEPLRLEATVRDIGPPAPETVTFTLDHETDAARPVHDLAQHFPEHVMRPRSPPKDIQPTHDDL